MLFSCDCTNIYLDFPNPQIFLCPAIERYTPNTLEEKEKEEQRDSSERENDFKVHEQMADQDRA